MNQLLECEHASIVTGRIRAGIYPAMCLSCNESVYVDARGNESQEQLTKRIRRMIDQAVLLKSLTATE